MKQWTERQVTTVGDQVAVLETKFMKLDSVRDTKVQAQSLQILQPSFYDEQGYHPAESVTVYGHENIKDFAAWLCSKEVGVTRVIQRKNSDAE